MDKDIIVPLDQINTESLNSKVDEFISIKSEIFSVELFQHGQRKSTTLIANQDANIHIKSKNKWIPFDFDKMYFVNEIIIRAIGFSSFNEMELSYEDAFTKNVIRIKVKYNEESQRFIFKLKAYIGGFGILPEQKLFSDPKITGVDVHGYSEETFRRGLSLFEGVETARTKIVAACDAHILKATEAVTLEAQLQEKILELESTIEKLGINQEEIEDAIAKENSLKSNLTTETSALQIKSQQLTEVITTLEGNIEKEKSVQHEISNQIAESEKKLRTLENDINLFPTEISGYVAQGSSNIKTYLFIMAIPIVIISVLTFRLIYNAEELVDFYSNNATINIIEFLASRLPYVIVSIAILGVCYTFIHRLISEVISINRRRQDLYKISIIATDVSNASASGSIIDGETEYKYRTYVKMEMLREHLRRHMGEGFTFEKKGGLLAMIQDLTTTTIGGPPKVEDDQ